MQKRVIIFLSVLLLGVVGLYLTESLDHFAFVGTPPTEGKGTALQSGKINIPVTKEVSMASTESAVTEKEKTETPSAQAVSQECQHTFDRIKQLDMEAVVTDFDRTKAFRAMREVASHCHLGNSSAESLQPMAVRFLEACRNYDVVSHQRENGSISAAEWRKQTHPCLLEAMVYRTAVNDWENRNQPASALKTEALKDRMIHAIRENNGPLILATAEQWVRQEPQSFDAAWTRIIGHTQIATQTPQAAHWKNFEDAIIEAKSLARTPGERNQLLKAELYYGYLQNRDAQKLFDVASAVAKEQPKNPVPLEFLAIAAFELGKKTEAVQYLQRINSPDARNNIARIEQGASSLQVSMNHSTNLLQTIVEAE